MLTVGIIIWRPLGVKKFSLNVSPQIYFHSVKLKLVDDMLTLCFASTAMTIHEFITTFTEYYRLYMVYGDATEILLFYCKHYHTEVNPGKRSKLNI